MTNAMYESGRPPLTIGVFSIATNRYADYWMAMARTADVHLFRGHEVVLTAFTDRPADVRAFEQDLERIRVNAIPVASMGWPEAPLRKFRAVLEYAQELPQDVLMHLDADMRVQEGAGEGLAPSAWAAGLALVRHPGYRRPPGSEHTRLYVNHPTLAARDLYRLVVEGGLGTWERSQRSTAFVPRNARKVYVCGATWLGRRQALLDMAQLLADRTQVDVARRVIATWHDESHLNWYVAHHPCTILDSDYCYVEGAPNLADLTPRIIAVEKNDERTR